MNEQKILQQVFITDDPATLPTESGFYKTDYLNDCKFNPEWKHNWKHLNATDVFPEYWYKDITAEIEEQVNSLVETKFTNLLHDINLLMEKNIDLESKIEAKDAEIESLKQGLEIMQRERDWQIDVVVPALESTIKDKDAEIAELKNSEAITEYDNLKNWADNATREIEELNSEIAELKALSDIGRKLAEWSLKYPRNRIYGNDNMDKELIELEEQAKEAIK